MKPVFVFTVTQQLAAAFLKPRALILVTLATSSLALAQTATLSHAAPWTMKRLPDTGQTTRNTDLVGEDSHFDINPPAFKNNGDGTVTDLVTGLQWQQADNGEMTWDNGVAFCDKLSTAGKNDWRLPFIQELFSIQNQGKNFPALDTSYFTKSEAEYWWAIEERVGRNDYAWATNAGGGAGAHPKSETISAGGKLRYHVRCVRGSELANQSTPHYIDGKDGTVTDTRTGLVWQKNEGLSSATWEEALSYANKLSFAGHNDWRLPNVKELESLSSPYAIKPAIDSSVFPETQNQPYWTSTTLLARRGNGNQAWSIDFNYGVVDYHPKSDQLHVRLVRGGATN
mgnify:CR=1 FL=1